MAKLVCMIGVIGSGKDYRAKKLVEQGYVQVNFADPLRELMWDIEGWRPENDAEYEVFKQAVSYCPELGRGVTGREKLQNLGQAMRKRDNDYWCDQWRKALITTYKNVVCSDLRFRNEFLQAYWFQDRRDVEFVFCDYRSDRYEPDNEHESERLAQRILKDGYKDGDILPVDYLKSLLEGGL